jgi:predicted DNA-binding antitoxin AbrB/MazE fold protein
MSQIEAIYQGGVFKPLTPVTLRENERVVLDVRSTTADAWAKWAGEANALQERIRAKYGVLPDSTPDIAEDRMRDV